MACAMLAPSCHLCDEFISEVNPIEENVQANAQVSHAVLALHIVTHQYICCLLNFTKFVYYDRTPSKKTPLK